MDATANQSRFMRVVDTLAEDCQKAFQNFLENFKNGDQLKYAEEAIKMNNLEKSSLPISFNDLREFNVSLSNHVMLLFYRLFPFLCKATKKFINETLSDTENNGRDYQCHFIDFPTLTSLRDLQANNIGKLVRFRSTVIRSNSVHSELLVGTFKCSDCGSVIKDVEQQFIYTKPTICSNRQCMNRIKFDLDLDDSKFDDFQKLRVQETQEELPRGCVPRNIEVILRGETVDKAQPGDLSEFIGTVIVIPDVGQIATPGCRTLESKPLKSTTGYDTGVTGLKSLGVRDLTYRFAFFALHVAVVNNRYLTGSTGATADLHDDDEVTYESLKALMTEEEMSHVLSMSRDPNLVANLSSSLFPRIYGNDEVKRGLLLMLFGGVAKRTREGINLRGDMNMCIVGDPSTAKSQFLRRIAEFAPRAVYTSGKATSAAGLTAAVVRDQESSEFVIEAGALLLANNGICCIDEFDKMSVRDQVALHEAMEQQTISLAKAGVKVSLKARTSVLAAANPIGGRYERARSLRQNIALSAPLMSRFDLFFVIVDECSEQVDYEIARRIMANWTGDRDRAGGTGADGGHQVYSDDELRRYIMFARCFEPRITMEALRSIVTEFKAMRERDQRAGPQSGLPVTPRQLDSLIRLAEATAKMRFSDWVEPADVAEAARLLNKTIVRVELPDIQLVHHDNTRINRIIDDVAAMTTEDGDHQSPDTGVASGAGAGAQNLTISYEQYREMRDALVGYLRAAEFESPETGGQVLRSVLIDWYLGTVIDTIADENDLLRKKQLVEMVIHRLVENDRMLIAVQTSGIGAADAAPNDLVSTDDDPIISLHPNVPLN